MKYDLTEGSIGRKLTLYFIPIAAGTLFQQLYNAADAVIVGKFVGTVALAAVGGSSSHVTGLLIGFFVALSGGWYLLDTGGEPGDLVTIRKPLISPSTRDQA